MKKYFYPILAATTMLFAASCQQDDELANVNGGEQAVTFEVNLPGATQTRAIADGVNVGEGNMASKLIWALYETNKTDGAPLTTGVGNYRGEGRFTATIDMVKGLSYEVLFLAYNEGNCAFDAAAGDDLKSLTLKSDLKANQEAYDAFVARHTHQVNAEAVTTVTLTRPFAQVNVATTMEDLEKANTLKALPTNTNLIIEGVPTVYNVLTGEATEEGNVTYAAAPVLKNVNATAAITNEDITVNDKTYQYLTMAYVLAGATAESDKSMHEATFEFYRDEDPKLVHTLDIPNLPIQRNYRTNVIGNILTQGEDFEIVIDAKFKGDHNVTEIVVANDVDLEKALRTDEENIIINLSTETRAAKTYNVNISAWIPEYYFGGASTKTITINGNGNTINFVHNNGDWNYIRCVNEDCQWFLNDVNLTNSGKNDGPWNRHDIRFYNAVELNKVNSDKAIALLNDGKLTNVNITEDGGVYGLWITAEGQTVDVDGLTITAERGIKIADEYVDAPEKVTLNVKNATFTTAKKAAVLVTSTAGAEITWGEGNNILGVAADPMNAVWVDEDYKNIEDVTATGCTVVIEGEVGTVYLVGSAEELQAALDAATDVEGENLIQFKNDINGDVTVLQKEGVNLLINGAGYKYDGAITVNGNRGNGGGNSSEEVLTFKNIQFSTSVAKRTFISSDRTYAHNVRFENCDFSSESYNEGVSGINFVQVYHISLTNCTATNMHSLAQFQSIDTDVTVENITVENCKNGVSFGNTAYPTLKNSTISTKGYGVRADGNASRGELVIENTAITSKFPVAVRKMTTNSYNVSLSGVTLKAGQMYDVVFTANKDEDVFEAPTGSYSISGADDYIVYPVEEGKEMTARTDGQLEGIIKSGVATVKLAAGTYIVPDVAQGKTVTFVGTGNPEDTKIATQDDGSYEGCDYSLDGSTVVFENISINTDSHTYTGYARCNGTYKNCIINGTYTLYGNSTFEGCTFNVSGDVYNIWTWGAPEATFTNCTFNSDGKAMLLYGTVNTKLTLNNCVFNDNGGLSDLKAAVEIGNDYGKSYELIVNSTTVNGYEINDKGINTGTTLWANKNSMSTDNLNVVVDGVDVY